MSNRTCSVPECNRAHAAKGYCQMHWNRNRIHGDPMVSMKGKAHKVQYTPGGLRICKVCDIPKAETEFHKESRSPDGLRAQCKPCRNGYMKDYYRKEDPEAKSARLKQYRLDNADRMRAVDMARYKRDKDKRVALASDNVRVRRARLAGIETDPGVTVSSLRKIHGDSCCYCGVEMSFVRRPRGEGIAPNRATLEHVLPISRGGAHTFDNTALACHRCNVSKNDKTLKEFEAWKAGVSHGRQEAAPASSSGN